MQPSAIKKVAVWNTIVQHYNTLDLIRAHAANFENFDLKRLRGKGRASSKSKENIQAFFKREWRQHLSLLLKHVHRAGYWNLNRDSLSAFGKRARYPAAALARRPGLVQAPVEMAKICMISRTQFSNQKDRQHF